MKYPLTITLAALLGTTLLATNAVGFQQTYGTNAVGFDEEPSAENESSPVDDQITDADTTLTDNPEQTDVTMSHADGNGFGLEADDIVDDDEEDGVVGIMSHMDSLDDDVESSDSIENVDAGSPAGSDDEITNNDETSEDVGIGMSGAGTFIENPDTSADPAAAVEDDSINLNLENHSNDEDNSQPMVFEKGEPAQPVEDAVSTSLNGQITDAEIVNPQITDAVAQGNDSETLGTHQLTPVGDLGAGSPSGSDSEENDSDSGIVVGAGSPSGSDSETPLTGCNGPCLASEEDHTGANDHDPTIEEEPDEAVPGPGDMEEQLKEMKEEEGL